MKLSLPDSLRPNAGPLLPIAGMLALFGLYLLGITLADLLTGPDEGGSRTETALPPPLPPLDDPAAPREPRQSIAAAAHLFGISDDAQIPATDDAPPTRLNLRLRGVLSLGQGRGVALIAAGSGPERPYVPGDDLGGARLRAIRPDHVLIERNGRLERLDLPRDAPALTVADTAARTAPSARDTGDMLHRLKREVLRNPARFAELVRISPHREDGRLIGYRIEPRGDPSLFHEFGLQPGDIVTHVNGTALSDPRRNLRLLRELRQARRLDLVLRRNGQEITISRTFE